MDPTARELDELEVVRAYDAYIEAVAGRGHEGPHDRDICPGAHDESHGEREDCSACGGAQYGTEDELRQAIDALRAASRPAVGEEGLRAVAEALDNAITQAGMNGEGIATWHHPEDRWVPVEAINAAASGLPCPIRSSVTDEPCVLLWGHAPDTPRFHRFPAALAAAADQP